MRCVRGCRATTEEEGKLQCGLIGFERQWIYHVRSAHSRSGVLLLNSKKKKYVAHELV